MNTIWCSVRALGAAAATRQPMLWETDASLAAEKRPRKKSIAAGWSRSAQSSIPASKPALDSSASAMPEAGGNAKAPPL